MPMSCDDVDSSSVRSSTSISEKGSLPDASKRRCQGPLRAFAAFFNPQPQERGGRKIQLFWVFFFSLIALSSTVVQVYTDAEGASIRQTTSKQIAESRSLSENIFDLIDLLGKEMEVAYEYNNESYNIFQQNAKELMRAVDTKLVWSSDWPSEADLRTMIPSAALRGNVSSPGALKTAIRAQRELQKVSNGLSELDIIRFYIPMIDQLALVSRYTTAKSPRFPGWQDFLAVSTVFQMFMNFRKYAVVVRKLVNQNRTLQLDDALSKLLLDYYGRYVHYGVIASIMSSFANEKLANLSSLDTTKELERLHALVTGLDFSQISGEQFSDITSKHYPNLQWILSALRLRMQQSLDEHTNDWPYSDIFSVPMYTVATAMALAAFCLHIAATCRIQRQIIDYHNNIGNLEVALNFVYDCIPKNMIERARSEIITSVQPYSDTCLLIMDICNIEQLMDHLEVGKFVTVMEDAYQLVETCLAKYECFKVDVTGSCFVLASGVGGHQAFDHVLGLVCAALDLRDAFTESKKHADDYAVQLRIGLHVGPSFSRIVYLQIPPQCLRRPLGHELQTKLEQSKL